MDEGRMDLLKLRFRYWQVYMNWNLEVVKPNRTGLCRLWAGFAIPELISCKASENQPDEGERAWLPATLEECLEALGILLYTVGAEPSGTFSFWRLARAN